MTAMRLAVGWLALAACSRAPDPIWRSKTEYSHSRRAGMSFTTTLTNMTSDARSLALRCRPLGKCDPNAPTPRMTITNGRGETVFDGVTCDELHYEVPGKQALAIEIHGNYVTLDVTQR
ncbi:MAG: hypothetical protein ACM31C_11925 [Acidobacteriota bacterium]